MHWMCLYCIIDLTFLLRHFKINNWRGILIKKHNPKKRGYSLLSLEPYWELSSLCVSVLLCSTLHCNFLHRLWAHSPTLSFPLQRAATKAYGPSLYVTTFRGCSFTAPSWPFLSLALCLHFTSSFFFYLSLPCRAVNSACFYSSVFTVHMCHNHRCFSLMCFFKAAFIASV